MNKIFYNPWGILIELLLLFPYVFLGKQWDFVATFIVITLPIFVIYIIVETLKKRKESKTPEE